MPNRPPKQSPQALRMVNRELRAADDEKILRVVAMLDSTPGAVGKQTILDPLRPRLAALRPARALRFTRLLFIPIDELIVPAPYWVPGEPSLPRSILEPIAATVRTWIGGKAAAIEDMIANRTTDDAQVVTAAGTALWPLAATILAAAPAPVGWGETGLRPAFYPPLARSIAAVLQRALALRTMARDAEIGMMPPDEPALRRLVHGMAGEPSDACTMLVRLILNQLPHAASMLRRIVASCPDPAARMALRISMDSGLDHALSHMESESGLSDDVRHGGMSAVGAEVQRIAIMLQELDSDPDAASYRPRLKFIRHKLDGVCRARFAEGVGERLLAPLDAAETALDSAAQRQLEASARDLRLIEQAGRRLGGSQSYDALLGRATAAVRDAEAAGTLTTVRKLRLVEILAGPDAAEAEYLRGASR